MSSSDELDIFSPGEMQENSSKTVSVRWNQKINYILASGSENGVVIIWDLKHNKQIQNFSVSDSEDKVGPLEMSWNTEVATQLSIMYNNEVLIWDLRDVSQNIDEVEIEFSQLQSIEWNNQNDNQLILCGDGNTIHLYDTKTGTISGSQQLLEGELVQKVNWIRNGMLGIHLSRNGQLNYRVIRINTRDISNLPSYQQFNRLSHY